MINVIIILCVAFSSLPTVNAMNNKNQRTIIGINYKEDQLNQFTVPQVLIDECKYIFNFYEKNILSNNKTIDKQELSSYINKVKNSTNKIDNEITRIQQIKNDLLKIIDIEKNTSKGKIVPQEILQKMLTTADKSLETLNTMKSLGEQISKESISEQIQCIKITQEQNDFCLNMLKKLNDDIKLEDLKKLTNELDTARGKRELLNKQYLSIMLTSIIVCPKLISFFPTIAINKIESQIKDTEQTIKKIKMINQEIIEKQITIKKLSNFDDAQKLLGSTGKYKDAMLQVAKLDPNNNTTEKLKFFFELLAKMQTEDTTQDNYIKILKAFKTDIGLLTKVAHQTQEMHSYLIENAHEAIKITNELVNSKKSYNEIMTHVLYANPKHCSKELKKLISNLSDLLHVFDQNSKKLPKIKHAKEYVDSLNDIGKEFLDSSQLELGIKEIQNRQNLIDTSQNNCIQLKNDMSKLLKKSIDLEATYQKINDTFDSTLTTCNEHIRSTLPAKVVKNLIIFSPKYTISTLNNNNRATKNLIGSVQKIKNVLEKNKQAEKTLNDFKENTFDTVPNYFNNSTELIEKIDTMQKELEEMNTHNFEYIQQSNNLSTIYKNISLAITDAKSYRTILNNMTKNSKNSSNNKVLIKEIKKIDEQIKSLKEYSLQFDNLEKSETTLQQHLGEEQGLDWKNLSKQKHIFNGNKDTVDTLITSFSTYKENAYIALGQQMQSDKEKEERAFINTLNDEIDECNKKYTDVTKYYMGYDEDFANIVREEHIETLENFLDQAIKIKESSHAQEKINQIIKKAAYLLTNTKLDLVVKKHIDATSKIIDNINKKHEYEKRKNIDAYISKNKHYFLSRLYENHFKNETEQKIKEYENNIELNIPKMARYYLN